MHTWQSHRATGGTVYQISVETTADWPALVELKDRSTKFSLKFR